MLTDVSLDALLLAAPGDGVAPSFLVSVRSSRSYVAPSQYLFNVPEGFSRLALEHRERPGAGLRAVFTSGTGTHAIVSACMRVHGACMQVAVTMLWHAWHAFK